MKSKKLNLNDSIIGDDFILDDFDPNHPKTCACGTLQKTNKNSTSKTNGYSPNGKFICIECARKRQIDLYGDPDVGQIWESLINNWVFKIIEVIPDEKYRNCDKMRCIVLEMDEGDFKYCPEFQAKGTICEYRSCLLDFELYKRIDQ